MIQPENEHYNLLIIEDNPLDAELVQERLRAAGYRFRAVVADCRHGFEREFAGQSFDLILADYALPDFDGLSALEIVRAQDKHLPFIFVSGVLGEDVAVETLLRGATDYVLKQKLDRLIPAVHRALSEYAAYQSRERAERDLRKVEEKFKELTNSLPAMVWTCTREGRLTYTNSLWKECIGEAQFWFQEEHVHPADLARCKRVWEEAAAHSRKFEIDCRFRVRKTDSYHWHIVHATPLSDDGGEEWVGTCTDIQQQKMRDAELKTSERLALIGRMSSVIAHEINNPLEALTNILYLIRSEATTPEQAKAYLADAEHELLRISAITKQTLMWSREESEFTSVPAADLMEETLKLFSGKFRNKGIQLHQNYRERPLIRAVPGEVRQVLANVISNAIDAVPRNGAVRVSIESLDGSDFVEFAVEDNGHGIEEGRMEMLFHPFQSTKGNLGNGLGLYVSKGIVDRHEGELKIHSRAGQGTRVSILLPRAR